MTDLDRLLDDFGSSGGAPVPPPGAEIRRRGDRLRRRRRALAVGGAVAAVVLVAVPLALVDRGTDDSAPPPSDTPAEVEPPLTEIPDDFLIAAGYAVVDEQSDPDDDLTLPGCDDVSGSAELDLAIDSRSATGSGGGFTSVAREALIFANPEEAMSAFPVVIARTIVCERGFQLLGTPAGELPGSDEVATFAPRNASRPRLLRITRVGTMIVYERFRATAGARTTTATVESATALSAPFYDAMQQFRAGTVVLDPAAEMADDRVLRADDVPGNLGPWSEADDDGSPLACQQGDLGDLGATTTLRRRLTAAGAEIRTVTLELPDVAAATSAREAVVDWTDACPGSERGGFFGAPKGTGTTAGPDRASGTSVDLDYGGLGFGYTTRYPDRGVAGRYVTTAVAQVADRVVLLTLDYGDGVARDGLGSLLDATALLRAAADRMVGLEPSTG